MRQIVAFVFLAACVSTARLGAVPIDLDDLTRARAELAAAATLGDPRTALFQSMKAYQLSDGSIAICGEMRGADGMGIDWGFAPIYVRLTNQAVLRVHIDDTTGYGPAGIACTRAAEGIARG